MKRNEIIDFLKSMNFIETSTGVLEKDYDNGKKGIVYKFTTQMVYIYYRNLNKTVKRMKGRYKHIYKKPDGSLTGFTKLTKTGE